MHTQSTRMAVLVAVFALAWRCGAAEPMRAAPDAVRIDAVSIDAVSIDLPEATRLALEQPGVRAAAHEVAASEAALAQAGRLPNPELQVLREGQGAGTRTTTVQLNQPIELGGKRAARMAAAREALGLAGSDLAARRQEVRAAVATAYAEAAVAQHRLSLAQELAGLAGKGAEVAARRVAAGKVSPIDATRARLAALDAAAELDQATATLAIARARLAALIGRPDQALVLAPLPEALPDPGPLAALQARAMEAAPVRRARSQLAAREAQARVERAARVPDLTLSIGSQREEQAGLPAQRQAVLGLAMPLPLFDRKGDALHAALRRSDAARDELAAIESATASDLAAAHARYQVARKDADRLRQELVPDARSAHALTLRGFEAGKFSFLDVLDAQRTWFQLQSRQWNSTLDAWRALAEIERIAGSAAIQQGQAR